MLANHIAWAAGLFEGEGSITTCSNGTHPSLQLEMTDHDVVRRFADVMGIGAIRERNRKDKPHWKPTYRWSIQRKIEVRRILAMLLPYLGDRRAHKALDILDRLECT